MDSLTPFLIFAAFVVGMMFYWSSRRRRARPGYYVRKADLFTAAEIRFLAVLDQAIAPGQRVFGKVRVMDLVEVRPGLTPALRQAAVNRLAQKHFDFVVCDAPTMSPVCAVELHDGSHRSANAKLRDELLAGVCREVGLPLAVVRVAASYDPATVRQQITRAIQDIQPAPASGGASR